MEYDILKPVSSRSNGTKDAENSRIKEIVDEFRRRCELYEAQFRNSKKDVTAFDYEQREAERFAKEKGFWLPIDDIFTLGTPGPSGNENDTYVSDNFIYKVNNLLNSGTILKCLQKIILHNTIFPDTSYSFHAFTGFNGRSVMPVFKQDFIKDAVPATRIEIETYMAALGFNKIIDEGKFSNGTYLVWDIVPRNVLKDKDGDIYVIDAEIK